MKVRFLKGLMVLIIFSCGVNADEKSPELSLQDLRPLIGIWRGTGEEHAIGKPVGSDVGNEKTTFVSVYGLDEATCKLSQLLVEATAALEPLGSNAKPLNDIARFIINRNH